jgi:hypothetical protein
MRKTDVAKLFQNSRSQAVRLPREFRSEGDSVRIRRWPRECSSNRSLETRKNGSTNSKS